MVLLGRMFSWRGDLVNVRPDTFLRWHRKGFRLFWSWKSRRVIVKSPVLFVDHVVGRVDLFHAVCQKDLEGIVAKAAEGLYQPEKTTWVKIKNPNYSQAASRRVFQCATSPNIWE